MGLLSFVAIDIETTGLDPDTCRIIELAAVKYESGVETACLSQLVDPECDIPLRIQNLTGIIPPMVRGKPSMGQLAPQLRDLIGDLPIVAHGSSFDVGFLRTAFAHEGLSFANRVYDSAELARVTLPRAKSHRLSNLVDALEVRLQRHHRAEDDARACGQVFLLLLQQIKRMDVGLLRFILGVGEPGNWSLAPLFRTELEQRELAGEVASPVMQWIRPFNGQLHAPDEGSQEGEPTSASSDLILDVLGPGGVVADSFTHYEHRPQQLEMASAVSNAFNQGHHLLIEAGTGTGKSLAYLVPAMAWAKANGEKVAISTHTINLQEQLWEKDIPFLQAALQGTPLEGVSAALVKGRSNYICLRKWEEEATGSDFLTSTDERSFHIRVGAWLADTETGDKSELSLHGQDERLWLDVMSETETCIGPKCKWYRNHCFAYRARSRARSADLLVLNHAVLFADIATGNQLLPSFRQLIVDEAHHLEDVATQNLGVKVESWELIGALFHLFRSAGQGMLPSVRRRLPDGLHLPARPPMGLPSEDHLEKLIDASFAARSGVDELFRLCAQLVESRGASEDEGARSLRLTEGLRYGALWDAVEFARSNAVYRLRQLGQGLAALSEAIDELEQPLKDRDSLLVDIQKQSGILNQSAKAIDAVLLAPVPGEVTWIEVGHRRETQRVSLRSAPINVGAQLKEKLFNRLRSVVMTSATLSVNGGFEHLKLRLGLEELPAARLATGVVSSPFDYRRQALLCLPDDLPSPKAVSEPAFTKAVEGFLSRYLVQAGGRTLVLFTSHRQLRRVYSDLKDQLESEGLLLLGQGLDGARGRLVDEFKGSERAVLFGSASFWEGVDIPGDGLTSVILVKLPFMPPGDPVMEARIEDLERRGLSSFAHLSLPQAVIRFKQGFGRLVRTKSDRGVVIVLDSRVTPRQSKYGAQFIRSLPGPAVFTGPSQEVIEQALQWLKLEDHV